MELTEMKLAQMEITETHSRPSSSHFLALAAARLKILWRSVIWRSSTWKSLVCRARSHRKALSVRETAALGDRRFVSVIQFERQRFLIGSSPSAVTLLARLADESAGGEDAGEKS
jgi:flagellar biogenesis protein FliO